MKCLLGLEIERLVVVLEKLQNEHLELRNKHRQAKKTLRKINEEAERKRKLQKHHEKIGKRGKYYRKAAKLCHESVALEKQKQFRSQVHKLKEAIWNMQIGYNRTEKAIKEMKNEKKKRRNSSQAKLIKTLKQKILILQSTMNELQTENETFKQELQDQVSFYSIAKSVTGLSKTPNIQEISFDDDFRMEQEYNQFINK